MEYDLNLRDYWRILRKRRWLAACVTVAFGVFALAFAEVQRPTPTYQAMAVVKYDRTTTLTGLLVDAFTFQSGDAMAVQAATVRSFPVLELAAKSLGTIPAGLDSETIRRNPRYVELLSDLRLQTATTPEENTNLIDIVVTSRDPDQAARIANAVARAYQEENGIAQGRQVTEARRFIEAKMAEVGDQLRQTEDQIRSLRERHGFVSLTEESNASLSRLTALETDLEKTQRAREETAAQLRALQDPQVVEGKASPRIFTDASDPTIAKLNTTLLDLTLERENLLITLTPQHPQVRELAQRIAGTRDNLLRELRTKSQALLSRMAALQGQIQGLRQLQRTLPDLIQQNDELLREKTLSETLLTQLRTKLQDVQIQERELVNDVGLVRPASVPTRPTNAPEVASKGIVGLLIGIVVAVVLAFVLESMDTSIATIEDVEGYLEAPVLGLIPNIDVTKDSLLAPPGDEGEDSALAKMRPFLVSLLSPRSTVAEAYRSLRTNIEFLTLEKRVRTLCLTSASLMEGKTTTAINLAITMAQMGKKTLLVEADLRKPFLHHAFGIPKDPGLTEVILGNKDWHECLRSAPDLMLGPLGVERVMATPNIDKLFILTSGTLPPNPTEFLNSERLFELITAFRQEFDFIIFDSPPVLPVTDAAILSSRLDGTLLVYRVGKIARAALKRAKIQLENVRGKVLGVVLTGLKAEISPDYEEMRYYRYVYGDEPERRAGRQKTAEWADPRREGRTLWQRVKRFFGASLPLAVVLLVSLLAVLAAGAGAWWFLGLSPAVFHPPGLGLQVHSPPVAAPSPRHQPAPGVSSVIPPVPPAASVAPATFTQEAAVHAPGRSETSPQPRTSPAPAHAFSLQVGSYASRARSLALVRSLRKQGLDAYTVPVALTGKGTWYRVLTGSLDSAAAAEATKRQLLAEGKITEAQVLTLPFAVSIPGLDAPKTLTRASSIARGLGYFPDVRRNGKEGSSRALLIRAFATPEDAEPLVQELRANGLEPQLFRQ